MTEVFPAVHPSLRSQALILSLPRESGVYPIARAITISRNVTETLQAR